MNKLLVTALAVSGFVAPVSTAQSQPDTVYTAGQAAAGKAAYLSSCVKCHTETLVGRDGKGEIPEFLRPYAGKIPPLAGGNSAYTPFLTTWGAKTTNALYTRIREAVFGFPPPNRALNDELYLNLTAYVLQVNGARAGTQPLSTATSVLIRSITTDIAPAAGDTTNRK